jgi:tetratricopeptide (TPR) repeat protein
MKRSLVFSLLIGIFLMFTAFQCSSTELTSAKLYIQQKNYDKAMESLNKEIAKNPKSDEGYYLKGWVLGEQGKYKEMIDAYDKSLAAGPRFKSKIEESRKYVWGQNFNRGVSFYNKATKATAEDSVNSYYEKAIEAFNAAIMAEPDSADTYKNLAFTYISRGALDESIKPLEMLLQKEKSEDAYRLLGEIYYEKGTGLKATDSVAAAGYFDKAIAVLEEGRKAYSDNTDILLVLSNSYIAANKIEVAIDAFKSGVEKDPSNKYYRYNYGVLLLGKNDFAGAAEQFGKAVELDPAYNNAIYNLAVTYVKWGSDIRTKAEDEAATGANVDAKFQEADGKYKQSLPYLQKLTELDSQKPEYWELLGKVYAVLGMTQESQDSFSKADQLR